MFNGCYPWSKNPALRCSLNNGLIVALITAPVTLSPDEEVLRNALSPNDVLAPGCETCKGVDESTWATWVITSKKEADEREQVRFKAMNQKIRSNQKEDALIF